MHPDAHYSLLLPALMGSKIMSALEILSATRKPSFEVIPTSFAQIATKITSYYKVHPQNTSSHKVHYTTTIFNP